MCNCVRVRSHARQVSCHASSVAALLEQDKVSVADVLTLNKAGSCLARSWKVESFSRVFHQNSWEPVFWKFSFMRGIETLLKSGELSLTSRPARHYWNLISLSKTQHSRNSWALQRATQVRPTQFWTPKAKKAAKRWSWQRGGCFNMKSELATYATKHRGTFWSFWNSQWHNPDQYCNG